MKYVTLKNRLDGNIIIQEGNAGVYRQLAVVLPGTGYTLKIDPNATYREYLLIAVTKNAPEVPGVPSDQERLPPISTDDLAEFKEIVVRKNGAYSEQNPTVGKYCWEGDPIPINPVEQANPIPINPVEQANPIPINPVEQANPIPINPVEQANPEPPHAPSLWARLKAWFH